MKKDAKIKFYIDKSGFDKIINQLFEVISDLDENFQVKMQDDTIVFTKNDNWEHWIASIGCDTDHINLYLHKGALLKDPKKKMKGSGTSIRRIEIHQETEIDEECLCDLLKQAIEKQTDIPIHYENNNH